MRVKVNSKEIELGESVSLNQLKEQLNIPVSGTAIAVNGKIVKADDHDNFHLSDGDDVILIGAAYGG